MFLNIFFTHLCKIKKQISVKILMLKKKCKSMKKLSKSTKTYTATSIKCPRVYHYKLLSHINEAVEVLSKAGYHTSKVVRQHITFFLHYL